MPKNQPELKLISLEDVVVEPVRWLWYPYIPLGKLSIIHGDPAEGKTTLALWIAAACSRGQALPGGETGEPLTVLYQTAEDGLEDTIKPRLLESQADLHHIYTIDETDFPLSMLDHRIGEAIEKTHAQLMILDPMQAYLGDKVDMNRANEVRTVMKGLTKVANQTGCAIVLVGHLNKSQTANSAQRGLGSMDFRAAARSVLPVGRLKNDRDVRVMVHDKSSLLEEVDSLYESDNCASRSEFMEKALRFYMGYLNCNRSQDYLAQVIPSTVKGIMDDTANRMGRLLFKMAVEQAVTENILAAVCEVDPQDVTRLRGQCIEEIRKTNGMISFEEALPCVTTSSPPCSTRGWTNRPLRSWQATGTPPFWRGLTAIPR